MSKMKIEKTFTVPPNKLYPTESIASIDPAKLNYYVSMIKEGKNFDGIFVILYDGLYFIVKGHHLMLAYSLLQANEISVHLVSMQDLLFFSEGKNLEHTLKAVGISALYDFEAIGNFIYEEYPKYY